MTLYNLRTDGDQWRITKFDNDLNVESSYLLSEAECECPAGHRPSCRHRQMLPAMLAQGICNKSMFWDFETSQAWHYGTSINIEGEQDPNPDLMSMLVSEALPDTSPVQMPERSIGPDCKSGALSHGGSNPPLHTTHPSMTGTIKRRL